MAKNSRGLHFSTCLVKLVYRKVSKGTKNVIYINKDITLVNLNYVHLCKKITPDFYLFCYSHYVTSQYITIHTYTALLLLSPMINKHVKGFVFLRLSPLGQYYHFPRFLGEKE